MRIEKSYMAHNLTKSTVFSLDLMDLLESLIKMLAQPSQK
jgi:hypothetical protein